MPKFTSLSKKTDLELVMKRGFWFNSGSFNCKVLELAKNKDYFLLKKIENNSGKALKLAISTGLKLSKKAVERNRARRLLREAIRLETQNQEVKQGYYFLFVPKIIILTKNIAELRQEVNLFLIKNKLI